MTKTDLSPRILLFGLVALTVYAVAVSLVGALDRLDRPAAIAAGITLDLVLTTPLLWYVIVVRRTAVPAVTAVPIALLGFLAASAIVPDEHHGTLRVVEAIFVPLELGVIAWIVHRAVRALRGLEGDAGSEPLVRYGDAARMLVKAERPAAMVATEITMFHYALASWRSEPHVPVGFRAFTYHVRSGAAGLAFGLGFLLVAEGLALHLWIHTWSPTLAWILTATNVYALVLIVADARAAVLRPILVNDSTLHLRGGLRWTLTIPRERVVDIVSTPPNTSRKNLVGFGTPTHWIVFDDDAELHGMYGSRKRVRAAGFSPDDADGLLQALGIG